MNKIVMLVLDGFGYREEENGNAIKLAHMDNYEELLEEQDSLKSEVVKLQDPEYVARYAREKYLYTKDGETILKIVDGRVVVNDKKEDTE